MEFYLAPNGWLYLLPGLIVYGLAWWKRPFVAVLVSVLAIRAVFDVLSGAMVEYWVLPALGIATAFAWTRGEWRWNGFLFVLGLGLAIFAGRTNGILYLHPDPLLAGAGYGMVAGFIIAVIRVLFYWTRAAVAPSVKKSPTTHEA